MAALERFVNARDGWALPDDVHRALKRQASTHGRSLQREVQSILADAVGETLSAEAKAPALRVSHAPLLGKVGRERIYGDVG